LTPYHWLGRLFPKAEQPPTQSPQRILLILPCCIGDVVLATATLKALRSRYPDAHITWAVGSWSKPTIEAHPLLNATLDAGPDALPVKSPRGLINFVRLLRASHFDLAVSLVRSPLMSLAVWLSGIPLRVGLDSAVRGFGYNLRVPVDPQQPRHEAEIYLETAQRLGAETRDCFVNVPVSESALESLQRKLDAKQIARPYVVINPAGGSNPGMQLDLKRWPPEQFASLIEKLQQAFGINIVLIGGPKDQAIVEAVQASLQKPLPSLVGELSFAEIAALAQQSRLYVGNDTGLTHLAAAAGANTLMILGPSDPVRYAPFAPNAIALWKPSGVRAEGVVTGAPADWTWERDGVEVDTVFEAVKPYLEMSNS
jgi:ADP-heptose:LPS heptosyltransferase